MQSPRPDPDGGSQRAADTGPLRSPGFWLQQAALAWRAELDTRLRPLGLTPTQFTLLATVGWLEHEGVAPTQQDVADHAGADRMMTSKIVRALEGRRLLTRQAHRSDARAIQLALTDSGRDTVRHATRIARDVDALLFGPDPAQILATLRRVAEHRTSGSTPVSQ